MGWETSRRRNRLPKDWPTIRKAIGTRDGWTCQHCGAPGNHIDHIEPGDDNRPSNLQTLCARCHYRKSRAEGGRAALKGKRAHSTELRKRPQEKHPGLQ